MSSELQKGDVFYIIPGTHHDFYRYSRTGDFKPTRKAVFDKYMAGKQYALVYLLDDLTDKNYVRIKVQDIGSIIKED